MSNLASFCARYSQQTMQLPGGAEFSYRYYRNPVARATVVLLPGGIGLPDLFYLYFERFAEHYSVITFDYQEQFTTNASRDWLSNTCSLARDMGQEARDELMSMVENQRTWKRRLQLIPMPVFRRLMAWAVMRKTRDLSAEERRLMQNLCDALQQLLNKQYQRHMWDCSIA